jgi:hypothetical protein
VRQLSVILASIALPIFIDCAVAEAFGPYFYRTGDEESYARWETTVHLNGTKLVVNQCGAHMHLLVSQGPRQCWSESYDQSDFSADERSIQYVSGDIEKVDRRTRKFTIEDRLDHRDIVRNVVERFSGWENAPASWQGH